MQRRDEEQAKFDEQFREQFRNLMGRALQLWVDGDFDEKIEAHVFGKKPLDSDSGHQI